MGLIAKYQQVSTHHHIVKQAISLILLLLHIISSSLPVSSSLGNNELFLILLYISLSFFLDYNLEDIFPDISSRGLCLNKSKNANFLVQTCRVLIRQGPLSKNATGIRGHLYFSFDKKKKKKTEFKRLWEGKDENIHFKDL